jgi:hypothetical protein
MNQSYAFPSWSHLGNAVVLQTSASLMKGQVISLKKHIGTYHFYLTPSFFSLWSYLLLVFADFISLPLITDFLLMMDVLAVTEIKFCAL